MNKTEFLSQIQKIGTCEDDAQRRTLLTSLSDSVSEVFDNAETLSRANENLSESNEALREANMQLFQKIGDIKAPQSKDPGEEPPTKRTYENLFNEKGELK